MNRELFLKLWDESWSRGIWIAPWQKAVAGLTPDEAAWSPAPNRHCIWQIVNHVCIWREHNLTLIDGRAGPNREAVLAANFSMPDSLTVELWRCTTERLRKSHDDVRAAIADTDASIDRLQYHLGHDCYHLGQIMYLRSMQGMGPIE